MDPAAAYRRQSLQGASPIGIIVLLYQGACADLRRAIAAMDEGDVETRTQALNHMLAIIAELKGALNYELGGAVAHQFAHFYALAERDIMDASCRQDPETLRELLAPFQGILEAWREVEARPAAAAGRGPEPRLALPPSTSAWSEPQPTRLRPEAAWQA